MIPVGYMAKNVARTPDWLKAEAVADIFSVSGCISKFFCDYIDAWKHNGYWLFDSPKIIREVAETAGADLSDMRLFFYECHEEQYHEDDGSWSAVTRDSSLITAIEPPERKKLEGFDVVTFWAGNIPECSPLSCNGLAQKKPVNAHCLLDSLDVAKHLLGRGAFNRSEPGPFRIFAVYSLPDFDPAP